MSQLRSAETHRQPETGHFHRFLVSVSLFGIIDQLDERNRNVQIIASKIIHQIFIFTTALFNQGSSKCILINLIVIAVIHLKDERNWTP